MATTDGLAPITRTYLARYYDKYPLPPLPDATTDLAARLRALSADLAAVAPIAPGEPALAKFHPRSASHSVDLAISSIRLLGLLKAAKYCFS